MTSLSHAFHFDIKTNVVYSLRVGIRRAASDDEVLILERKSTMAARGHGESIQQISTHTVDRRPDSAC